MFNFKKDKLKSSLIETLTGITILLSVIISLVIITAIITIGVFYYPITTIVIGLIIFIVFMFFVIWHDNSIYD